MHGMRALLNGVLGVLILGAAAMFAVSRVSPGTFKAFWKLRKWILVLLALAAVLALISWMSHKGHGG